MSSIKLNNFGEQSRMATINLKILLETLSGFSIIESQNLYVQF